MLNKLCENSIVAWRFDGLMQRINAIVNGLYLAEKYSLKFYFCWPKTYHSESVHHSVPNDVRVIFSETFIQNHYIDFDGSSGKGLSINKPEGIDIDSPSDIYSLTVRETSLANIAKVRSMFLVSPTHLDLSSLTECDMTAVFNIYNYKLFNDTIKNNISRVLSDFSDIDFIALHVRGGDVVHGSNRFWGHFARGRSIPLPVAHSLIKDFAAKGSETILFGATPNDLDVLSKNSPSRTFDSFNFEFEHPSHKMLAEIAVMAGSKFSVGDDESAVHYTLNSLGTRLIAVNSIYSLSQQLEIIKKSINEQLFKQMNRLNKSFCYFNAYLLSVLTNETEMLEYYLMEASRLDDDNPAYCFMLCIESMANNSLETLNESRLKFQELAGFDFFDFTKESSLKVFIKPRSKTPGFELILDRAIQDSNESFNNTLTYIKGLVYE
jgi:hypothetical protein